MEVIRDIRYAARVLSRSPGFTAVAVFTLALGIGANSAIFSLANAMLLHPLPYEDPGQIVLVMTTQGGENPGGAQPADFLDWRASNHVFEEMAAKNDWASYRLTDNDDPVEVIGAPVSAAFFSLLRVQPILGRVFLESEDRPGAPGAVLLSERLWIARYSRDPHILGRSITIDGRPCSVVGVMAGDFSLAETRGDRRDLMWVPLAQQLDAQALKVRERVYQLRVWARLRAGVTLEEAQAEMDVIARRFEQQYPKTNTGRRVRLVRIEETLTARVGPQARLLLRVLLGAVGLVLGIACANVANLLLARASSRRREIAIRIAIGAHRLRIVRQLLTESLLLAALGGLAGLLFAWWCIRLLPPLAPAALPLPRLDQMRIDGYVVAFAFALSMATAVLFGLAPAVVAARGGLNESLKLGNAPPIGRSRLRSALVVAQVALSLILLTGASLLVSTFLRLLQTNPGLRSEHVLTLRVPAPDREMERFERQPFYSEMIRRIEAIPGVRSAALASRLPFSGPGGLDRYSGDGPMSAVTRKVTPGYFDTLGIPLRAGRFFEPADNGASSPVVVINETMARRYWPGANPIGSRISEANRHDRVLPHGAVAVIVGIAADARQRLEADPAPEIYFSFWQTGEYRLGTMLLVRTATDPLGLAPAIRRGVHELDSSQPVMDLALLDRILVGSIAPQRFNMILLSLLAATALALACAGIYGVVSFWVGQRTSEIGIRMALGARAGDIGRLVLLQGLIHALVGVALGIGGALGLTRFLASQLYGVSATNPLTFVGVSSLLLALAAVASYLPARRASRIDPIVALRHD